VLARLRAAIASDSFPRHARRAWLAVIVGVLGYHKIAVTLHTYGTNVDGGFYTDVARHVRDGQGLVSSCSTLHAGYPRFPFPTAVYPLWPLLLGWVAKVVPIFEAGKWLATACYFATLGFAYLWGTALHGEPLLPRIAPGFNAGHVLVLMFGMHEYFFQYTSFPYTEGVTYALTCAALWRMTRLLPRPTWVGGLEIGVWLGLVVLGRYQMVLMAMAAFPVLAGAAALSTGPRRLYAWMTLAAAAGMLLVVGPHYLYVRSFTPGLTPALYVQWQRVRFSEGLSPIPDVLVVKGALPWIQDRLRGFTLAFDPRDKTFSYAARYQAFPYALVAAVPLLAWLGVRNASRDRLRAGWAWVRRPENLPWVHAVVLATGCFVMIHSMHMQPGRPYPEWYFSQRHALVCVFAFFLSLLLLFTRGGSLGKVLGAGILCASVYLGLGSIRARAHDLEGARAPGPSAFVQWLNDEAARRGGMIVVLRQPQSIAWMTRDVGYHWYYYGTNFEDVRAMVALGAAYVVVPGSQSFPFTRSPEFDRSFHLVRTLEGNRIYAPDPSLVRPPEGAAP
jgi:hypothetical protein